LGPDVFLQRLMVEVLFAVGEDDAAHPGDGTGAGQDAIHERLREFAAQADTKGL
jgi:hypothetical protein